MFWISAGIAMAVGLVVGLTLYLVFARGRLFRAGAGWHTRQSAAHDSLTTRATSRTGKASKAIPAWASFFSPDEYREFLNLVEGQVALRWGRLNIDDGVVRLLEVDPPRQMGLLNLAQACHAREQREWSRVICGHFEALAATEAESADLAERIDDFESIADQLAIRIFPEEYFGPDMLQRVVSRVDLEHTNTALVIDLPSCVKTVDRDDTAGWRRTASQLFSRALENVYKLNPVERSSQELGEGRSCHVFFGEHFYVASHVLLLDRYADCLGRHGALVGVPHRHSFFCFPINDLNVVTALQELIPVAHGMFRDGPGSITPCMYWYHDGQFLNLPYELDDRGIHFNPPPDFLALLNSLSASGSEGRTS